MKVGDWVAERNGMDSFPYTPRIGKVKDIYDREPLFDMVFYDHRGEKIGRLSEPFDGPRSFEPALEREDYVVISMPKFPLERYGYANQLTVEAES